MDDEIESCFSSESLQNDLQAEIDENTKAWAREMEEMLKKTESQTTNITISTEDTHSDNSTVKDQESSDNMSNIFHSEESLDTDVEETREEETEEDQDEEEPETRASQESFVRIEQIESQESFSEQETTSEVLRFEIGDLQNRLVSLKSISQDLESKAKDLMSETDEMDNLAKNLEDLVELTQEDSSAELAEPEEEPAVKKTYLEEARQSVTAGGDNFTTNSNIENIDNLELFAQEPWPKDVRLFQPYEVEQILLPDNANCLAVQAFLKMCQLDFQVEPRANAEAMSPSGKVPFIKVGAFIISELEPIVQFVNNKGITLTEELDVERKSDMRAYMSLVHNVIEVAELYICWCDKETYNEVTSVRHGSIYPWPLNHIQNRSKRAAVIKKLKILDWYSKGTAKVIEEVESCCQALADRLDKDDYFFGKRPTELDALVFGHLYTILTTPLPTSDLANTVRKYPDLIKLIKKIESQYFKRDNKL